MTRIISKHKDTEYGQIQYMVECAPEHLTEWDIQLKLDDGFRLISSTPTSVNQPTPTPADCSVCHNPLHLEPTSTCSTCPHFAVHSQCRPALGPATWQCDWCARGKQHDLIRLHEVQWAPCLQLHDTISETPSGPTALTAFNSGFVPSTTPILHSTTTPSLDTSPYHIQPQPHQP